MEEERGNGEGGGHGEEGEGRGRERGSLAGWAWIDGKDHRRWRIRRERGGSASREKTRGWRESLSLSVID